MARPKEFDRDAALERAMTVFWQRGYEATSTAELVDALGIGRQSMYDTFGDKHALYLLALDHYRELAVTPWKLLDGHDLQADLSAFFGAIVGWLVGREGKPCMIVNATCERSAFDADVAKRFLDNTDDIRRHFTQRLARARKDGELPSRLAIGALADYFTNTLYGLQLSARATRDRAALLAVVDIAVRAIA